MTAAMSGWRSDMENAPRDGTCIDLWCECPPECDWQQKTRLTGCGWYVADEIFPHTGWVRVMDDGNWDLVEGPPTGPYGLPAWHPTHWRPINTPDQPDPTHADLLLRVEALEQGLRHYSELLCEGFCEGNFEWATFSDDQCAGCRARALLGDSNER